MVSQKDSNNSFIFYDLLSTNLVEGILNSVYVHEKSTRMLHNVQSVQRVLLFAHMSVTEYRWKNAGEVAVNTTESSVLAFVHSNNKIGSTGVATTVKNWHNNIESTASYNSSLPS